MAEERVHRRLAAILAADVAGYSRLMHNDEEGTHAKLTVLLTDAVNPAIGEHGGRIVKNTGDGFLAEFSSAVEAVRAAVQIQKRVKELTIADVDDRRIAFRVGINIGDVIVEPHDIFGDGVNIAARLESIAEPGGICISSAAYDYVRGKVGVEFADLGVQNLKNIALPVRVYAVGQSGPGPQADRARLDLPTPPRLSIVVLPFANLSGDHKQDYYVDGVTESLITDLSRIRGSFVIGRHTAFTYQGNAVDLKQIGRELNVSYVLEGSMQRSGDRLRINVQLVDAETGAHLWADRFDKAVADLFVMQDEIVSRLAYALNAQLIVAEATRAERSLHPSSMDLFFQGRALVNQWWTLCSPECLTRARRFFEQAFALDPKNIDAVLGMAAVDVLVAETLCSDDRAARLAAAEAMLVKALPHAPNEALAHSTLADLLVQTNRAAQGIAECKRALTLNHNLGGPHALIGIAKTLMGRAEETEAHINEAIRISPRHVVAHYWLLIAGTAKLQLSADAEAVDWLQRSIEANCNYSLTHFILAAALALLGSLDEARAAAKAGLALDPSFTIRRYRDAAPSDNPTYLASQERVYQGMRMAGVPEEADSPPLLPDRPSIAVLPFENMSGDPEQEYFADGMVEELITALSRFKSLFVIARNSSFVFKGQAVDIKEVGRRLGVRYVLEGSVRKASGKVRIAGQLIDAVTGAHLWVDRFERDLTDVFALQDDVTIAIVSAIQPKMLQTEIEMATRRRPENLTAYDFYLRAMPQYYLMTREGMAEAIRLAHRALELDPRFGSAAALAGDCHASNVVLGYANDPQFDRKEAVRLARLALRIDDDDPDTLSRIALISACMVGDREAEIEMADRAVALNPNSWRTWNNRGWVYKIVGLPEEAIRSFERAIRMSPVDPLLYMTLTGIGGAVIELGRFDEAIVAGKKALRQNPSFSAAYRLLASAFAHLGRDAEAGEATARALELDPAFTISAAIARGAGKNAELCIEGLRKAGLPE